MIVQHHVLRQSVRGTVTKCADEVGVMFMVDGVRHHDAIHFHGIYGKGENISVARILQGAIGNGDRQVQATDDLAAVRAGLAERNVGEDGDEVVFRRLLVF